MIKDTMTDRIDVTEISWQQARKLTIYGKFEYKHKKSGGTYKIVAFSVIEATFQPVVVYRNIDNGATFTRPEEEFFDGRFEPIREVP